MTTLVGKDASLEDTLDRFKRLAASLQLDLTEEQWLNPLPDLWSVHLSVTDCPVIYSNGKGSSHDAALASAYGELFERMATHMSFSDYFLGLDNSNDRFVHFPDEKWSVPDPDSEEGTPIPEDVLNEKLRAFYSSSVEVKLDNLTDLQSSSFERGVCSIPFTNASTGEIVYFPVNLLDNLYASNGMSAGNSEHEALVQGLSEIIERYVKGKIIREGLTLPQVPQRILEKYPKSFGTLQALQSDGLKAVCYDASLGGRYPVVCVVLFNQSNGTCVASFGSHPIFEVALDRTLTELMQGRSFSDLDGFEAPTFSLEKTADITNIESHFVDSTGLLPMQMFRKKPMYKFVSWDFEGNTHDQYKALRYIIERMGFDIYLRSYQSFGLPVYRIIIPGMSEIYPTGDLVYNNTNDFVPYQEGILSLPSSEESPEIYRDYLDELENESFDDNILMTQALGILADEDSPWKTLCFGELKCLLALAAGDSERSKQYAEHTVLFNSDVRSFDLERMRFYKCLLSLLECREDPELNEEDYYRALGMVYGEPVLQKVRAHLDGSLRFNGLESADLNLTGFNAHQALIRIYKNVKKHCTGGLQDN